MKLEDIMSRLAEVARSVPIHYRDGILGSMTTPPHPLAKAAFDMFQGLNVNDEELYRPLRELEEEAIKELGSYLGGSRCTGYITSGGSESNLAALYLAREHGFNNVYYTAAAHHSITKAAYLLRMRPVEVKMKEYRMDPASLRSLCKANGPGVVVVTVGTTSVGTIDPVEEVSDVAAECDSIVHVDAALGGLVAPFVYPNRKLGFQNGPVMSATLDPHKLGLAPLPAGGLIVRDEHWFKPLDFKAEYYPAGHQVGLFGTRSGGPVAATWAIVKYMGRDGYAAQAHELMERTRYLLNEVKGLGLETPVDPEVPVVCIEHAGDDYLMRSLAKEGVYVYKCGLVPGIRVVVMPHVTKALLDKFVSLLREVLSQQR
ncbi:L-tyrosine decarboxylase [Acidilobus saccharovorans 345-15]|uniref:L-tyrosine decarboxylase n=1 Tax=Acidilobus saccharovorans (strain DSM 16705 / JCM 18335 / VKM B-2471 / 345-15) TaxID=666510 RepID=D9Q244_ACIS3|nr:tyrosine decarboxylase MfnA [Acidilobus saccharovorans]ADL19382.1 L-tyrosine decarboxylase [Acidilobus saccharovorans 345-15]